MSRDNVEVVRKIVDAINRRDTRSWAAIVAPQFEFRPAFVGVEGRVYRGRESGARYFADLADAFDSFEVEFEDGLDVGDGRVLATMRVSGRGRASGADFETHTWVVVGVRAGKIVSGQTYLQHTQALEAVNVMKKGPPR
jgi:ketosteroid isomerase-like protein